MAFGFYPALALLCTMLTLSLPKSDAAEEEGSPGAGEGAPGAGEGAPGGGEGTPGGGEGNPGAEGASSEAAGGSSSEASGDGSASHGGSSEPPVQPGSESASEAATEGPEGTPAHQQGDGASKPKKGSRMISPETSYQRSCTFKMAKDVEESDNCTSLVLYDTPEVMTHPELYEKIKDVTEWIEVNFTESKLERLCEADAVTLSPRGKAIIKNNRKLKIMPRILMNNPYESTVEIWGNPQLDTTPMLNECKRKNCPNKMLDKIQQPFTCDFELPIPEGCRNVIGNFDLTHYDKSFDQVESIIGTMSLTASNATSFPKMKKLHSIRQKEKGPVIIIENNPVLHDLKALYGLKLYARGESDGAVRVDKNPQLCVTFAEMENMFVLEYLSQVDRCTSSSSRPVIITKQQLWIIITILAKILSQT